MAACKAILLRLIRGANTKMHIHCLVIVSMQVLAMAPRAEQLRAGHCLNLMLIHISYELHKPSLQSMQCRHLECKLQAAHMKKIAVGTRRESRHTLALVRLGLLALV